MKVCIVTNCEKTPRRGRYCPMHQARRRRNNGLLDSPKTQHITTPAEMESRRFWPHLQCSLETQCWEWQRGVSNMGYGIIRNLDGRNIYAHRFSYELAKGSIPAGLVIDHLCSNRRCANPEHLEAVTQAVNIRRATGWKQPTCPLCGGPRSRQAIRCMKCELASRMGSPRGARRTAVLEADEEARWNSKTEAEHAADGDALFARMAARR